MKMDFRFDRKSFVYTLAISCLLTAVTASAQLAPSVAPLHSEMDRVICVHLLDELPLPPPDPAKPFAYVEPKTAPIPGVDVVISQYQNGKEAVIATLKTGSDGTATATAQGLYYNVAINKPATANSAAATRKLFNQGLDNALPVVRLQKQNPPGQENAPVAIKNDVQFAFGKDVDPTIGINYVAPDHPEVRALADLIRSSISVKSPVGTPNTAAVEQAVTKLIASGRLVVDAGIVPQDLIVPMVTQAISNLVRFPNPKRSTEFNVPSLFTVIFSPAALWSESLHPVITPAVGSGPIKISWAPSVDKFLSAGAHARTSSEKITGMAVAMGDIKGTIAENFDLDGGTIVHNRSDLIYVNNDPKQGIAAVRRHIQDMYLLQETQNYVIVSHLVGMFNADGSPVFPKDHFDGVLPSNSPDDYQVKSSDFQGVDVSTPEKAKAFEADIASSAGMQSGVVIYMKSPMTAGSPMLADWIQSLVPAESGDDVSDVMDSLGAALSNQKGDGTDTDAKVPATTEKQDLQKVTALQYPVSASTNLSPLFLSGLRVLATNRAESRQDVRNALGTMQSIVKDPAHPVSQNLTIDGHQYSLQEVLSDVKTRLKNAEGQ